MSEKGEAPSEIDLIFEQARRAQTGQDMAEVYNRFDQWAIGSGISSEQKAAYRDRLDSFSTRIPRGDTTAKHAPHLVGEIHMRRGEPIEITPPTEKLGPESN